MQTHFLKKPLVGTVFLASMLGFATNSIAESAATMPHHSSAITVGGQSMASSKDIVDNAATSADHTTLVAAVKAAGLVDTLKGHGPFTVFAPDNAAFAALPQGTVEKLMKQENKGELTNILSYHVVPGKLDAQTLMNRIKAGNGRAELRTANGAKLIAMMNGPRNIILKDEKGGTAEISTYDVYQSNGVIQVINHVLMPAG